MRKVIFLATWLVLRGCSSPVFGQSRAEAGAYVDYLGISQTNTNNFGLGARFGYRAHTHLMLEGEFTYSYGVNFQEAYLNIANGSVTAIGKSSIGVTDVLFGPMLQPARGHLRPFATMKAGWLDFRLSPSLLPYNGVVTSALGIRTSNVDAALYPGGGLEAVLGPVGLRLEFGDVIYFNEGGHNNVRIGLGPVLRF